MEARDIQLNFINRSGGALGSRIVLFQQNSGGQGMPLAWQVIAGLECGASLGVRFPSALSICTNDSWGNFSSQLPCRPGDRFETRLSATGNELSLVSHEEGAASISLVNKMKRGAANAWLLRGGKKAAGLTNVAPGGIARFELPPVISIALSSNAQEGNWLGDDISSRIDVKLNDIRSMEIVLTKDENGNAKLSVELESVVKG